MGRKISGINKKLCSKTNVIYQKVSEKPNKE